MVKKSIPKPRGPECWDEDDEKYPRKRDICSFCGQRDDLKMAFDTLRYICINDHACMLRWHKSRLEQV